MWFLIVTLFPNTGPLGVFTGHALVIILYTFLFLKVNISFPVYIRYLIIGALFFSASIVLSHLANYDQLRFNFGQLKYAFVPIYWLLGLLAGVVDSKIFRLKKRDFFFYFAAVFILVQIPLVFSQIVGYDSLLWISEKARDWSGILRVVGTLQNPNTLGIITVFCIIIFAHFFKRKPFRSKVLIGIGILIVLATGSRTSLILVLFLPLIFISQEKLFSKSFINTLITVGFVLSLLYFALLLLKDTLPYMSQILNLFEGKSIHTLNVRISRWENIRELYYSSPIKNKLFGFGPGYFTALDNSYYYILFNYGIITIIAFCLFVFLLLRSLNNQFINISKRCFFSLVISSVVLDSMISFLFMTVIFYFLGLSFSTNHRDNYSTKFRKSK